MSDLKVIYRLMSQEDWRGFGVVGIYNGAPHDIADGFIHFSTAAQTRETARLHYTAPGDCVLVEVDTQNLGSNLKWEASRGGDLFPHLFAPLQFSTVTRFFTLHRGGDGLYLMPDCIA